HRRLGHLRAAQARRRVDVDLALLEQPAVVRADGPEVDRHRRRRHLVEAVGEELLQLIAARAPPPGLTAQPPRPPGQAVDVVADGLLGPSGGAPPPAVAREHRSSSVREATTWWMSRLDSDALRVQPRG